LRAVLGVCRDATSAPALNLPVLPSSEQVRELSTLKRGLCGEMVIEMQNYVSHVIHAR
jgi:hypothetical protein